MPKQSRDHLLADSNYAALNRGFYAASPADYFDQRYQNLILVAGNSSGREELLRAGTNIGDFHYRRTELDSANAEQFRRTTQHFAIAEAKVLAHHLGETILRLYLAHEGNPPCPPLELARVRSPQAFKTRVERRFREAGFLDAESETSVANLFHLVTDPTKTDPPVPREIWRSSLENIEKFLRYYASSFLDDADLYNAAKHGLALTPGEASVELQGSPVKVEGPAIEYLGTKRDKNGQERWAKKVSWVQIDRELALIAGGLLLLELFWDCARYRYARDPQVTQVPVRMFTAPAFDQVIAMREGIPMEIRTMSMTLAYWLDVDEQPV